MRLSVVMNVRDGEAHLPDAIDSVLAQSFEDFEFVIVDDASRDGTASILSGYARRDSRLRVIRNDRCLGPANSANRGLGHARGDVIARHDADDVSPPDRFAIQLAAMHATTGVSLVTGVVDVFGPDRGTLRRIAPPAWQPRLEWELLFTNAVGAGGQVMFPRVFDGTAVVFPSRCPYAQDYALWVGLARAGAVVCPGEVVYRYRRHGDSISSRNRVEQLRCAAEVRREYQAALLGSATPETLDEATAFWDAAPLPDPGHIGRAALTLLALRASFLGDVERRFGAASRATLAAELEEDYRQRLGEWLYRSLKDGEIAAFSHLLSLCRSRRESARLTAVALSRGVRALARKARR